MGRSSKFRSFVSGPCAEQKNYAYGIGVSERAGKNSQSVVENSSVERACDELLSFRCCQVSITDFP